MSETDTSSKYPARDIVDAAAAKKPASVSKTYADAVIDRVHELVRAKQMETALRFGAPEQEEPEEDESGSTETE